MNHTRKWVFTSIALFIFASLTAQQVVKLQHGEAVSMGPHLEYFVDSSGNMQLETVRLRTFTPSKAEILNLANLPFNVWLRFSVVNVNSDELYLEVDNALLENLEIYSTSGETSIRIFEGGFTRPFRNRPISAENFQFHLNTPKGQAMTYYIKANSSFPMMVPVTVATQEAFTRQNQRHNLFWGIYIGVIIFAFLYNLFIYTSVRERNYLYYILYILGSSVFYLGLQGFSFKFLWPEMPMMNTKLGALICITNIIITLFSMRFLQITRQLKLLYIIGLVTVVGYALIALLNLTPAYPIGLGLAQMLSMVTCIYFIFAAIIRYRQGISSAKYYLIAWSIFLVLVMVYILTINGVLPAGFFTTHSIFIGHMTEVLLLSFALADRINFLKRENERSQREIIRQLEENEKLQLKVNRELEDKVRERTTEVVRQKNEAEAQRARSDELLLNILPAETAEELKATGKAKAKHINEVTVLFTDIQNFTTIAETYSPSDLVSEINECFSAFDRIMEKHGVEKIKTIGDSYMAAGGLPVANDTHAFDVVSAALEIQEFMQRHRSKMESVGNNPFRIRIGIHTGPVVAGIVGIKKFAYDIWGDTVNLASRMESAGEVDKVNISEATYNLVKDKFHCTYRGKHEAKNKGRMDMYFVEKIQ
jgi:class 3 adenylate cyclase